MRRSILIVGAAILGLAGLPAPALAAPAAPVVAGAVASTTTLSGTGGVAISGRYAYTTAYSAGRLVVVDISNPSAPTVVGATPSVPSLTAGSYVTISGNDAFVVSKNRNAAAQNSNTTCDGTGSNDDGSGNALTIVDISNPASPTIVGTLQDPSNLFGGYGVAVSGQYAYVASQGLLAGQPCIPDTSAGAFSVIDVSNLSAPKIVGHLDNKQFSGALNNALKHATSVALSGHYAFVTAFYDSRLTVVDVSNPLAPKVVASLRDTTNLAYPDDVAIQGNYAYIAVQVSGSTNQFTVVDISNPTAPHVVSSINNGSLLGQAYRVRVRGHFAYVAASGSDRVTAIDISNPASPQIVGSVTSAGLNSATGLDVDSSGRYVVAASPKLSGETKATYPPYPLQSSGPVNTGTISLVDLDPTPIGVSISAASEPPDGTQQTSANFSFSPTDSVSIVRCSIDGAAFAPCTTSSTEQYTALAAGSHTFTVQATDAAGNASSASYGWSIDAPPQNIGKPAISGSATVGSQLTASNGTWSGYPAPTFSYEWWDCDQNGQNCQPIAGAASSTYTVASSDVGDTIEVTVTATNSVSAASATSGPTALVTSAPLNTASPAIAGTAAVGSQLTASSGSWSANPPATYGYQWKDCDTAGQNCVTISGASGTAYTPTTSDAGMTLEVAVTASNTVGSSTATSAPTAAVTGPPQNTAAPTIQGSAQQGQTLNATDGTWSGYPAPTFTYQWLRCDTTGANCSGIPSATSSSYLASSSDVGSTLEYAVTATNGSGNQTAASQPTAVVTAAPQNKTAPTVSGTATRGAVLTASGGTWSGSPTPSLSYQWERCSQTGGSCAAISGSTATTYTLGNADVGMKMKVAVAASNSAGSATATSAGTAIVTGAPVNTVLPNISGTASAGSVLTSTKGTWSAYPTPTYTFQWKRCNSSGLSCVAISGQTKQSYTLQSADVGSRIVFTATAANTLGTVSATSTTTAIVKGAPVNQTPPTISGTASAGSVLTATSGAWSAYPSATYAYQWLRCDTSGANCGAITGATASSYTVTSNDVGFTLAVTVKATNSVGSASATSAATATVAPAGGSMVRGPSGQVTARLTVVRTAPRLLLEQVVVALRKGPTSAGGKAWLAGGVKVYDSHGRQLPFTSALRHGALVITVKRPAPELRIVFARPFAVVGAGGRARPPHLMITAAENHNRRISTSVF